MDRKKFVTLFSASVLGAALIKVNPMNFFISKNGKNTIRSVEVKPVPDAIKREKSGKNNG